MRVWLRNFNGQGNYSINGADKVPLPAVGAGGASEYGWADLNFTGVLTELGVQDETSSVGNLQAIEVDGKILLDAGILALAKSIFPNGLWWIKSRES